MKLISSRLSVRVLVALLHVLTHESGRDTSRSSQFSYPAGEEGGIAADKQAAMTGVCGNAPAVAEGAG